MTRSARPARVAVVGGGISGLAAAHHLIELGRGIGRARAVDVTLLEAAGRTGGVISTVARDGCLLEEGPDSFITDKPWARDLAERLGLSGNIIPTQQAYRRTFVVRKGRLLPIPEGFQMIAPTKFSPFATTRVLSLPGKLRMLMDLVLPRGAQVADESLADFVTRRFGREALERIAQPMIGGIYGADPAGLSLRATFPRFLQMEESHRSVIRAMLAARRKQAAGGQGLRTGGGPRYGLFASFDGGMSLFSTTLAASIAEAGCGMRTGARVVDLSPRPGGGWRVGVQPAAVAASPPGQADGALFKEEGEEEYDAVVLAMRAPDSAALLRPLDPVLADLLCSIRYGSAATLSLAFSERDVGHPMDGFGFVVPSIEKLSIIAATFSQRKYAGRAPEGTALIRAFWSNAADQLSDEAVIGRTLSDLRSLIGIRGAPRFTHLARYPASLPQYQVGHLDLVDRIESALRRHEGLLLAGNAYRGVGVPDCVRSGETAAKGVASFLELNGS